MFCIHCGARNPENASFCSTCGKAIGAAEDAPAATQAAAPTFSSAERSLGNAPIQSAPSTTLPPQPAAQGMPQAITGAKAKPVLWVLAGFAACLLIVIAMAVGSRLNSSGSESGRANTVPEAAPASAPATDPPPAATPTADSTPAPAVDNTAAAPASEPVQTPQAPAPAPVPAPAPAAPQNPIVGDWKATTFIGSTIGLHLGADGRYVLNPGSDEGVYAYSSGDGTLRLQSNSFFSKGIMVWSCQVMGDTLSCVDADGAGHVYNRAR